MFYMRSFNSDESLITYWDEPTITMDYDNHEFHEIISKNWSENLIPNMVLSSATLPKMNEISEAIADFKSKFTSGAREVEIYNIVSHRLFFLLREKVSRAFTGLLLLFNREKIFRGKVSVRIGGRVHVFGNRGILNKSGKNRTFIVSRVL